MRQDLQPLNLAIVGHTNTGKTSLLRTLLRDEDFGEIADSPGTTRHVESVKLISGDGLNTLILHDTPGLEDAMGLLDYLDSILKNQRHLDGPERIQKLLDSPAAQDQFEQEARVLSAVLKSDAALYVIDARDPVLPKHKDELSLLNACGKPLLPVLNFTRSPEANSDQWRQSMARLGLHTILDFDTVAPALDGEKQLLDRLGLMLDKYRENLNALLTDLEQQKNERKIEASRLIAKLLLDTAAFRITAKENEVDQQTRRFRARIKEREQLCVTALLDCYKFSQAVYPYHKLPLTGERWGMDLFNPQALKVFGVDVTKGIATGAMAGLTIDVLTGGLSLGSATLLGAIAGGSWQGINKWGKKLVNYISGAVEISIEDSVLELLAIRQIALVKALENRGHAAVNPIEELPEITTNNQNNNIHVGIKQQLEIKLPDKVESILNNARVNPDWSSMNGQPAEDIAKDEAIKDLTCELINII